MTAQCTPISTTVSRSEVIASPSTLRLKRLPSVPGRPRVLSLLGKGGSTKTTTAIQLAGIAAVNNRVLILDTDPQKSATGWRSLRQNPTVAVQSCRPQEVAHSIERAGKAGIELVLVDNPPVRSSASAGVAAVSDLSLVMVRASTLDLVVGMEWISWLKTIDRPFAVIIGAAPIHRRGIEAPFVREARTALRAEGSRVWKYQISHLRDVVESVGLGLTLMELKPQRTAAAEFCRLWNGLMFELEAQA